MPITPAKEVKEIIEGWRTALRDIQQEAVDLSAGDAEPLYITAFGQYMNAKMDQVLYTVNRTLEKIPERFRGE